MAQMMRAAISVEKGRVVLNGKPVWEIGSLDAISRITDRRGNALCNPDVSSSDLTSPLDALSAVLGDKSIRTSPCPGRKERMRRMQDVISSGRADLSGLVTHRFKLDQTEEAYELFANQRDGVLNVAIKP